MPLSSITATDGVLLIAWSFSVPEQAVWAGFGDQAMLSRWLGQPIECDVRAGGTIVVDHGEGYVSRSVVTDAERPRRLAMTWQFPDEPESRLAVELRTSAAGTVMELEHADLGSLVGSYGSGWITHLTYLEAAVGGVPIPQSQFWPLHRTFELLHAGHAAGAAGALPVVGTS